MMIIMLMMENVIMEHHLVLKPIVLNVILVVKNVPVQQVTSIYIIYMQIKLFLCIEIINRCLNCIAGYYLY